MTFNDYMHDRNIYKANPPNFQRLAETYPEFREHCTVDLSGKVNLNFKDAEAVRSLTVTLLKHDFGLTVQIPEDCLVPRIPLRLNYLLWLEDLMAQFGKSSTIRGFDIGTGASCVYPLLGRKLFGWQFVATEKNSSTAKIALANVDANGFTPDIQIHEVDGHIALLPIATDTHTDFHFCMCNPPFYDTHEVDTSTKLTAGRTCRPLPHSATVAHPDEVAAEGGEVGFVGRIIDDSVVLRNKIRIYTSMLGKKSSLAPLKRKLKELGVAHFTETTFCQGKTLRWALAWTFDASITLQTTNGRTKKEKPLTIVMRLEDLPDDTASNRLRSAISFMCAALEELRIIPRPLTTLEGNDRAQSFSAEAQMNTWSHARRKRRMEQRRLNQEAEEAKKRTRIQNETSVEAAAAAATGVVDVSDTFVSAASVETAASSSEPVQNVAEFEYTIETDEDDEGVTVEFRWSGGSERDSLNQIVQYLRNYYAAVFCKQSL